MRTLFTTLATAVMALSAVPASATTVFSDGFNTENGGNSFLNYTSFANFSSTGGGFVDLVRTGDFGITCAGGSGSCVDLDGSPGPGRIESLASFAFNAGDRVRLSFDLGGSQRSAASDIWGASFTFGSIINMIDYGHNYFGSDVIAFPGSTMSGGLGTFTSVAGADPFSARSLFFTAGSAGTLTFSFESSSSDNVGPLLDNVSLDITPGVPEPATWMMMILGFGMIGGALRRRQSAPALAAA